MIGVENWKKTKESVALHDLDIVYPVRPTKNNNEELRYSLRTVCKNLPHHNVYIYTSAPIEWLSDEAQVVLTGEELPNPNASVNRKLLLACHDEHVSDPFILMNDDFFIMKKLGSIPSFCLGTLEEGIAERGKQDLFRKELAGVLDIIRHDYGLPDIAAQNHEIHAPVILYKDALSGVITEYPGSLRRSLYFAQIWRGYDNDELKVFAKKYLERYKVRDCKCYLRFQWPYPGNPVSHEQFLEAGVPVISTTNQYWSAIFGDYMKRIFDKPSKYEKGER